MSAPRLVALLLATGALVGCGEDESTQGSAPTTTRERTAPTTTQATTATAPTTTEEEHPPGWVTRKDMGKDWPLTVDAGTLACDGDAVTFTTRDGTTYAVNGTAQGRTDLPDIRRVWADDPSAGVPGLKKNIGPLIERGLELCD